VLSAFAVVAPAGVLTAVVGEKSGAKDEIWQWGQDFIVADLRFACWRLASSTSSDQPRLGSMGRYAWPRLSLTHPLRVSLLLISSEEPTIGHPGGRIAGGSQLFGDFFRLDPLRIWFGEPWFIDVKMTDIVIRCSIIFASGCEHLTPFVNVETTAMEALHLPNLSSNLLSSRIANVLAQFHSPLNTGTGRVLVIDLATTGR
jgi:hypothetical protein